MLVPTGAEGKYEYDPSIPAGSGGGGDITVESLSVTENDTYTAPAGKAYSPVVVNVAGGGGSSDFSIAHVTITTTATHPFLIEGPCLAGDGIYVGIPSEFIDGSPIDIVMYKGNAYLVFVSEYSDYNFVLTGDITRDGTDIFVTGDGTITITDNK